MTNFITQELLSDVFHSIGFELEAVPVESRRGHHNLPSHYDHYEMQLTRFVDEDDNFGRSMVFFYSAHPEAVIPYDLLGVLSDLLSDTSWVVNSHDFPDWADQLGYTDLRLAWNTYQACIEQGNKFQSLLLPGEFDRMMRSEWDI